MRLSKDVWNLVIFNTMMTVIFNFTSIFVNLFLWGTNQNLADVTLFNLSDMFVLFFSYLLGSYYLYHKNARFVMVCSCLFATVSFIALYLMPARHPVSLILFIGVLVGITQGLYWAANNSAVYFFLRSEDYPDYFSATTLLSQGVSIGVPLFASGLIHWLHFQSAFLVFTLLVVLALFLAWRLPEFSIQAPLFRNIRYREIFSKPGTRWSFPLTIAIGAVSQFQGFFSMIFLFHITNNEIWVAILNVGYSIALFIALMLYKRLHLPENLWLVLGVALILVSDGCAVWLQHSMWMVLVVLFMQLGNLYFSASTGRQGYRLLAQDDIVWRTKVGIWLEFALFIPRTSLLAMTLLVHHVGDTAFWVLAGTSLVAMASLPMFQYRAVHEFERAHGAGAGM